MWDVIEGITGVQLEILVSFNPPMSENIILIGQCKETNVLFPE